VFYRLCKSIITSRHRTTFGVLHFPISISTLSSSRKAKLIPFPQITGLDAVEKKFGQGKIDPEKQRATNEKVTDGARGMFEKATGYASLPNFTTN